jgi:NADPH2:quinone reductase
MSDFRMIIRQTGGPDVIEREDIDVPVPGPGAVCVRQAAIGLNFIDTYYRQGLYPIDLPSGLGTEAAGTVEAVGDGVTDFAVGDRVAYGTGPLGAYATVRTIPADHLVPLPDAIATETAAGAMLKGMTAAYLVGPCARVQPGQTVLVHAAAGGMGSILVPWLAAIGATVIAHAGTPEKAQTAKALGADHVLSCPMDELADAVRQLTGGDGVPIVLDGVGKASWPASLGAVARTGLIVTFGNASGPVPAFDALTLMRAGSIFVTRPTLADYARSAEQRRKLAESLFDRMASGLQISIGQRFKLENAGQAHEALAGRSTSGSTILTP